MIKVYYGKCKDIDSNLIDNSFLLERINSYNDTQERKLKINVYYNILRILKEEKINPIFKCNEFGKIYLNDNELFFNTSHSNEYFAIAISSEEIGVDIEKIRCYDEKKLLSLREKCLTEKEKKLFPVTKEAFIKLWTIKESFLKLLGTGINLPLKEVEVDNKVSLKEQRANYKCFEIEDYILTISSFEKLDYKLEIIE